MIQMEQPPRYVVQALAQISFIKYQPLSQVYAQSVMSKQQQCRVQKTVEVKLPIIILYIYYNIHIIAKKRQAAAQTETERSMLNITYRDRKTNIWVREKTKVTDKSEDGSGPAQATSAWYEITGGHRVSPPENPTYEGKRPRGRPTRRWRGELDDYLKGTIWQRIAQDRQMWKQHAEAFAQPRDTMAAQWW